MSEVSGPGDRRLINRRACLLSVRYRLGKQWHPATVIDLSDGGCRLRLGQDIPAGTRLAVVFEAPVRDGSRALSVEVEGSVVWSRLEGLSHQVGIHFAVEPAGLRDVLEQIR